MIIHEKGCPVTGFTTAADQYLLVGEMTPALFAVDEAERAARNLTLVDVQMIGAAGRL